MANSKSDPATIDAKVKHAMTVEQFSRYLLYRPEGDEHDIGYSADIDNCVIAVYMRKHLPAFECMVSGTTLIVAWYEPDEEDAEKATRKTKQFPITGPLATFVTRVDYDLPYKTKITLAQAKKIWVESNAA